MGKSIHTCASAYLPMAYAQKKRLKEARNVKAASPDKSTGKRGTSKPLPILDFRVLA